MESKLNRNYMDYRAQCQVEGKTPLSYEQWLDRMERFCYGKGQLQVEISNEE